MKILNLEGLNDRLDYMWKNGYIEKRYVPFIKTSIHRPMWSTWNFFFKKAFISRKPEMLLLGGRFLWFLYRGNVFAFLYKFFPGLIIFPYFEAAWDENESSEMNQINPVYFVRLFDKAVNS